MVGGLGGLRARIQVYLKELTFCGSGKGPFGELLDFYGGGVGVGYMDYIETVLFCGFGRGFLTMASLCELGYLGSCLN